VEVFPRVSVNIDSAVAGVCHGGVLCGSVGAVSSYCWSFDCFAYASSESFCHYCFCFQSWGQGLRLAPFWHGLGVFPFFGVP